MCARYNPLFTDGNNTRTLAEFKREAKTQGLIIEPDQLRNTQTFTVLTTTPGGTKPVKRLRKIGAESITKTIKS